MNKYFANSSEAVRTFNQSVSILTMLMTLLFFFVMQVKAQQMIYDPYHFGAIDNWKEPFARYTFRWGTPSTDHSQWRYEFDSPEFKKMKLLSDCTDRNCPERIAKKLRTDKDVKELRALLPLQSNEFVKTVIGLTIGMTRYGLAYDVVNIVLGSTQAARKFRVSTESLDHLIARGGEVVYEERITLSSGYWFTRSLYYRIKLGDEMKIIPLWVSTLPATVR